MRNSSENSLPVIRVTAAVLFRDGRVLIARRPPGKHLAGKWEFPGGKIEAGETPEAALTREMREEFGIEVAVARFVAAEVHDYGVKRIELLAYRVRHVYGEFMPREHDAVDWVYPADLNAAAMAPADEFIVRHLQTELASQESVLDC
jgi:8-oxo-dGTP diphosphatase